jgi:MerR family mercuric resistance operon transcriptional regulator
MDGMRIGELAKQAKVNLQTIHYYERRGLLARPPRTASNYRIYNAASIQRVHFIKRAQELGFSLSEIKELLSLRATPRSRCGEVKKRAQAKAKDIDEKVWSLQAMRKALSRLIGECSGKGPVTQCPILGSLDSNEWV